MHHSRPTLMPSIAPVGTLAIALACTLVESVIFSSPPYARTAIWRETGTSQQVQVEGEGWIYKHTPIRCS